MLKRTAKKYLKNYLRVESLLHKAFSKMDYCSKSSCIEHTNGLGCCICNWHKLDSDDSKPAILLRKERKEIYEPSNNGVGCEYHSPEGCTLETHKPVVCITCMCPSMLNYMQKIGLNYTISGTGFDVEKVLEGKIKGNKLKKLISGLEGYLEIIDSNQELRKALLNAYNSQVNQKIGLALL